MKLVICEKPSVAKSISKELGAQKKGEGYFFGNDYVISWCYGHLVQLAQPAVYDNRFKVWNLGDLPIIIDEEILVATLDEKAAEQLSNLQELLTSNSFSEVINACDAGREGELIFRNLYKYCRSCIPIKRAWLTSLTSETIQSEFLVLKKGDEFNNLAEAARQRSLADWLVGINATRALTLTAKRQGISELLSLGRVQTPVLAFVVGRDLNREKFVSAKSYRSRLYISNDEESGDKKMEFKQKIKYASKGEAERALLAIGDVCEVISVEKSSKEVKAPLLFSLTTLQQESNKQYGFTASQTLVIAQALYEKQFITYPRTESCYLPTTMKAHIVENLKPIYCPDFLGTLREELFNDSKITDHFAIIPTENRPGVDELGEGEAKIYALILNRFLANHIEHLGNEVVEKVLAECVSNDLVFSYSGVRVISKGWAAIDNPRKSYDEPLDIEKGDIFLVVSKNIEEVVTKPPAAFTDATLLKAMINASSYIEPTGEKDEEDVLWSESDDNKKVLNESGGLGTPATRASIIETLIERGYLLRKKKSLVSTPLGRVIITNIKDVSIASPKLTAFLENQLKLIEEGQLSSEIFRNSFRKFVKESVETLTGLKIDPGSELTIVAPDIGNCPKCQKTVKDFGKYVKCTNPDCTFSLSRVIRDVSLTDEDICDLLAGKKTRLIKGFLSTKKKKYDAYLQYENAGTELKFSFQDKKKTKH